MIPESIRELSDRKLREEARKYFIQQLAFYEELIKNAANGVKKGIQYQSESEKKTWYLDYFMRVQHAKTLQIFQGLFEAIFEMYDDYSMKLTQIEKNIQSIGEKAGVDFSKMKTDVEQLKETVGPKVNALIQLLAKLRKEEKKRKRKQKNGEFMLV